MPPAVHLRDALALIGPFPVLAGVDLEVDPGEVVLVQGPNGSGKTSLLRACAGLLALHSGQATILGHDLARDRRAVRRQVAMVGHAGFLYDDLSVLDNVRFALRAAGGPAAGLDPALRRLGLDGRLRKLSVGRLSAGQRRRVALAVVVARRPRLWLLDEPHAGLDAEGRDLLDGIVREAAGGGATVLLASHEADRVRPLADRVVTMSGGRLSPEAQAAAPLAARSQAARPLGPESPGPVAARPQAVSRAPVEVAAPAATEPAHVA